MTTAFVLSGGGNLGAVQAGQLRALLEAGIRPDLIVGTSVGAINGAFLAGACSVSGCESLTETWRALRRRDVFPAHPLTGLAGFSGRRGHLVASIGLQRLLRRSLQFDDLADAPIALAVVACDLRSGKEVVLTRGNAVDAICASAAIPGVFPPVIIDGYVLVDGGIANNAPVSHAVALGATTIWVLPCGYACALPVAPRSAGGIALQAIGLLIHQRLTVDIERYRLTHDLQVLPTLCPLSIMPTDFGQSERLMGEAYDATSAWLADGTPDITDRFAFPHRH